MKYLFFSLCLLCLSSVATFAELYVGKATHPLTKKPFTFTLEFSKEDKAVGVIHASNGSSEHLPVVAHGKIYFDSDGVKDERKFFVMKRGFGDEKHGDSLTGFYSYPGGYTGFLRIDVFSKKKEFLLYDDLLAEGAVINGALKQ